MVTARSLTSRTGTDSDAVLFAGFESSSGEAIEAESARVDPGGAVGTTVIRTVADAPGDKAPRTAVTVPAVSVGGAAQRSTTPRRTSLRRG